MNRRDTFKLMIAAAIAPAFVANGLMRIKPIIVVDPLTLSMGNLKTSIDKLNGYGIIPPYFMAVHPDHYEYIKAAELINEISTVYTLDDRFLGVQDIYSGKALVFPQTSFRIIKGEKT